MQQPQARPAHLVQRRVLLALPIAAATWLLFNRPDRPTFNVKEIGVEEAKALITAGAIIVDVRDRTAFAARHLVGALSAPVDELAHAIPAALAAAKAQSIVVYCGDGVTHGPQGTELLNKAGYARAVNLKPGIEGWAKAGLPIEYANAKIG